MNKMPDRTPKSAHRISRRTVLRGAGVTMALPWLESLPAFAGVHLRGRLPEAFRGSVHGQWRERGSLGRRGFGRRDEAQQDAGAARAAEAQDQRDSRSVPQARHRSGHSSRADGKSALRRDHSEGRHHQGGHHGRSDDRQPRRPGYGAVQHRSGLRAADDRIPRDELLDGLQLAHLLADVRTRRSRTKSTRRWPGTTFSKTAAACAT